MSLPRCRCGGKVQLYIFPRRLKYCMGCTDCAKRTEMRTNPIDAINEWLDTNPPAISQADVKRLLEWGAETIKKLRDYCRKTCPIGKSCAECNVKPFVTLIKRLTVEAANVKE